MSPLSLRILVTCDWYNPGNGGGAERVAYEVGRRLAAAGHNITVVATDDRAGGAFPTEAGMNVELVPARSLAGMLHIQASMAPGLIRSMRRAIARARPNVIWAHSLQFQTTVVAAAWARRYGVPLVVTAHIGDLRAISGMVGVAARAHEAVIGRLVLRAATRATAVSNPVAVHLRELAPGLSVDVVPNGVDIDKFRPSAREPSARLRVGFMGRLVVNKGPEIAVSAVSALCDMGIDAELSVAGSGPEEPALRRLADRLGLHDRVRFEGYRADPEVWLRTVDVLVRPSLTEGMPLGVLEAMASGVPVVLSDIPANAWLVNECGAGILVPVGKPTELARAVAGLAWSPVTYDGLRSAGLVAAASFGWDRTRELTETALLTAIAQSTFARSRSASLPAPRVGGP